MGTIDKNLRSEYIAMFSYIPKLFDKITFPGLSRSEFMMMHTIIIRGDEDKGLRVSDLASNLGVSTPAVSRMIKSLVDKGYISKKQDEKDRRITYVSLSEAGREKSDDCGKRMLDVVDRTIEEMGNDDIRELIRISTKLFKHFEEELDRLK